MAKIIVSENMTLDGVVEDPTGEDGSPHGGWFTQVGPADREAFGAAALEEARAADAFLMGRRTYAFLSSRWPARTGPLADRLNRMPKHVVSTTLADAGWANTSVITTDVVQHIGKLKRQVTGDVVVPASFELVRTLFAHDLVDELRVMVYPVVLGVGTSLFAQLTEPVSLHLRDARTIGDHLMQATYEIARVTSPAGRPDRVRP